MRRVAAVLLLTLLGVFGLATPAFAHNQLTDSNPKDKASLDTGPDTVVLTFDQPVQAGEGLNTVAVTSENGDHWEGGVADVDSNVVTTPVRELGPAGVYTIAYRVISADGHPVDGTLTFTLTAASDGTPAPPPADSAADDSDGVPIWVWIGGAVLVLAAGLFFALRIGGKPAR
jgi:methionine-rich copper-binding protein CopC